MITRAIKDLVREVRKDFEDGSVDMDLLKSSYYEYNPLDNLDLFIERAKQYFPYLNCGLTAVCLKEKLGQGLIINGRYENENHTFLMLSDGNIVDITADQFGGPKIYIGPLQEPWFSTSNKDTFYAEIYR